MKQILIIALSLSIWSCNTTKSTISPTVEENTTELSTQQDTSQNQTGVEEFPLIVNESFHPFETGDAYRIINAKIYDDQLRLVVSYGGGCEEHDFELQFNNAYAEQDEAPTRINLGLFHDAKGDVCRAMITTELRYNLSNLKKSGYTKIKIKLTHWENDLWYESSN